MTFWHQSTIGLPKALIQLTCRMPKPSSMHWRRSLHMKREALEGDAILHDLVIVPFQSANQAAVKGLILAGLTEHWGALDPTKNLDLHDIGVTYAQATFLVAWWHGAVV